MPYQPYMPSYGYQQNQQSYQQIQPNQQSYQQSYMPGQSPLMNPSSGITWVQGEVGARAYPVGAGNSVLLMDSDDKYFYIKSADMSGMPKLHKYYYSEVVDEVPAISQNSSYDGEHTHEDTNKTIEHMKKEIKDLQDMLLDTQEKLDAQMKGNKNG